jgi:hypothetical protein
MLGRTGSLQQALEGAWHWAVCEAGSALSWMTLRTGSGTTPEISEPAANRQGPGIKDADEHELAAGGGDGAVHVRWQWAADEDHLSGYEILYVRLGSGDLHRDRSAGRADQLLLRIDGAAGPSAAVHAGDQQLRRSGARIAV